MWADPLVAETLGGGVRQAGRVLHREHNALLRILGELPRVVSHLDFWPLNLIRRVDGEVVALDWAFAGDGAIGEDLGNHVPDAAFDLFVAAKRLPELDAQTFASYVAGLRAEGWSGDERIARLGVCGSAVKYAWLLPLMLERARSGRHHAYGGEQVVDLHDQYRQRGAALEFLARQVAEAREIVAELGLAVA
jgi:thiamine kinase-like enzyme